MESAARYTSSTQISCLAPSSEVGKLNVDVSNNRIDFTSSGIELEYTEHTFLYSIFPTFGPLQGNTVLQVFGSNFVSSNTSILCIFDGTLFGSATVISNSQVNCFTPPSLQERTISLTVMSNESLFSVNMQDFHYYPAISLHSLVPSLGTLCIGTSITIFGHNFISSPYLSCQSVLHGQVITVNASWITSTSISCTLPNHTYPSAFRTTIRVSNNAFDFSLDNLTFQSLPILSVSSFSPSSGPTEGGTPISVFGHNFGNTPLLRCKLAETNSPVMYMSSSYVKCYSPRSKVGMIPFSISNDGIVFVPAGAFHYYSSFYFLSVTPSIVPVLQQSIIKITGIGVQQANVYTNIFCKFGAVTALGTGITSSFLICRTPKLHAQTSSIMISFNQADFFDSKLSLEFVHPPKITAIEPTKVPMYFPFEVFLLGYGFDTARQMLVELERLVDPIEILNSSVAKFRSDLVDIQGIYDVKIGFDELNMLSTGLQLVFDDSRSLIAVYPSSGPSMGGTVVTLKFHSIVWSGIQYEFFFDDKACKNYKSLGTDVICSTSPHLSGCYEISVGMNGKVMKLQSNFEYYELEAIISLIPSMALAKKESLITVIGNNFMHHVCKQNETSPMAWCRLSTGSSFAGLIVSSTEIHCLVKVGLPGEMSLEISSNGIDFTTNNLQNQQILVIEEATVLFVTPTVGPSGGGLVVSFTGLFLNFWETCMMGDFKLNVPYATSTSIQCIMPPSQQGKVLLHLSSLDFERNSSRFLFVYKTPIILKSYRPDVMNNEIFLVGENFLSDNLQCFFGAKAFPGTRDSSSVLLCSSPGDFNFTIPLAVFNPSSNSWSNSLNFQLIKAPMLFSLIPSQSDVFGRNKITIIGSEFHGDEIFCRFNFTFLEPAELKSSSEVRCLVPSVMEPNDVYLVHVIFDGRESESFLQIRSSSDPRIEMVKPTVAFAGLPFQITIFGSWLPIRVRSWCKLGHVSLPTTGAVSSSMITCDADVLNAANISLAIETENGTSLKYYNSFIVHPMIKIASIIPQSGHAGEINVITLSGENFFRSILINFNGSDATSTTVSSSKIICMSPIQPPGRTKLTIRIEDYPVILASFDFFFAHSTKSLDVFPRVLFEGQPSRIHILGIESDESFYCKILDTIIPGLMSSSSSHPHCLLPAFYSNSVYVEILSNTSISFGVKLEVMRPFQLARIQPSFGYCRVENPITLMGSSFSNLTDLMCGNLEMNSPAAFVSSTSIKCILVTFLCNPLQEVWIFQNFSRVSRNSLNFVLHDSLFFSMIEPTVSSLSGGIYVFVHGHEFLEGLSFDCKFGNLFVEAQILNRSTLKCTSPPNEPGIVEFAIAINRFVYSAFKVMFLFEEVPVLQFVTPTSGPYTGGTLVTIIGSGFQIGKTMCKFCDSKCTTVVPTFWTDGQVCCLTPSAAIGTSSIYLFNSDSISSFAEGSFIFHNASMPTIFSVEPSRLKKSVFTCITLRGNQFDDHDTICKVGSNHFASERKSLTLLICCSSMSQIGSFELLLANEYFEMSTGFHLFVSSQPKLMISQIMPSIGVANAKLEVFIFGQEFQNDQDLRCTFDSNVMSLKVLSSTHSLCVLPPVFQKGISDLVLWSSTDSSFRYSYPFQIVDSSVFLEMHPSVGPSQRNPVVRIRFQQPVFNGIKLFMNKKQILQMKFISPSILSFLIPRSENGTYALEYSVDSNFFATNLYFRFYDEFTIDRVEFSFDKDKRKIRFFIHSTLLPDGIEFACKLGNMIELYTANRISSSTLSCTCSLNQTGNISLSVTANNIDFVDSNLYLDVESEFSNIHLFKYSTTKTMKMSKKNSFADAVQPSIHDMTLHSQKLETNGKNASLKFENLFVSPSTGPTQGHSLIRLISVGWESPAYVTFSHSSGFFDTQVLSSTVLECMTPAGRAGPVTVEVVSGRGNQSQVLFGKYLYKEPDLLLGVTPSVCPENGGIVITVAGEHFVAGADALCRFGSIVEEGVSVSNKLLVCRCPANRAGDVYLEVSSNGIDFSVNKIQFVYSSQTIIFSAFPSVVISSVQTIVHLHITPDAPAALYCYFGNWSVEAFPESSSRLSCESPVHAPGDIVLSIGGAERPFSTRVKFTFLEAPHITSLNPSMWPSSAVRTTIRIVGTGFDTAGASCMFGEEEKVAAIIRSSSVALCKSSVQGDTQGVEVKLFFDKMRYMTNGIKLHYYERPVMMKIIPSVVSHKDVKSVTIYGDSFASSG
eukprot:768220-Hanusia_phi.AAC.2